MLNPLKYFSKPEYFMRPQQTIARFARIGKPTPELATVRLPWKASIVVHTGENVGMDIYYYGIFDKIVPEAIWRLLDRSETAVDIGANIGQNSLLMAARSGRGGRVIAFEPHPEIFEELKANHERSKSRNFAPVRLESVALGETNGEAALVEMQEFPHNRGSAALRNDGIAARGIRVSVRRLADFLEPADRVGVCKIDVEGHELAVLKGATDTLERRAVRDIVFEDFNPKPNPVTEFLAQRGYTIFELHETWLKPRLASMSSRDAARQPGFSFNYLATLDAPRAMKRFRSPGWRCLLNL